MLNVLEGVGIFILLFGIVFLFFSLGAHSFPSGRYRKGGYGFALILTVIFIFAIFWSAAWGRDAWPAFFALCFIIWAVVSGWMAWKKKKEPPTKRGL